MNRRRRLLLSALAAPVVGGCKVRTINDFPVTEAQVRVANVMLDAGPLDFYVGGAVRWPAVPFQGTADYLDFDNESQTFFVRQAGSTADLTSVTNTLAGDQPYTLVAFATLGQPFVLLAADVNISTGSGRAISRFLNCVFGSESLDIYVTTPDQALADVSPSFSAVSVEGATSALQLEAGQVRVRVTLSGSLTPVYDSGTLDFFAEANNTLILYTIGSSVLPQLLLLENGGPNRRAVIPNTQASARIVNGTYQGGAIDAKIAGTLVAADVAYAASTVPVIFTAGERTIDFEADAVPGTTIASLTRSFAAALDATILVVGAPGAVQALAFDDDNRVPDPGLVRVRFINGSSDDAAYDVFVGEERVVAALAARTASPYFLRAGGDANVSFRNPATGATVLSIANADLPAGGVVSVVAVGVAADLDPVLVDAR